MKELLEDQDYINYIIERKENFLYSFKKRYGHTVKTEPLDSIVEKRWGITGEFIYFEESSWDRFTSKAYDITESYGPCTYAETIEQFKDRAKRAAKNKKLLPQLQAAMELRHVRIIWHYNDGDDRNHSDFYRYDNHDFIKAWIGTRTIHDDDVVDDDDDDDDDDDYDDLSSGGGFMKNDVGARSSAVARSRTGNGNGKDDDDNDDDDDDDDNDIGDGSRGVDFAVKGRSYFFNTTDDDEAEWDDDVQDDDRDKKRQRKNDDNAAHDKNERHNKRHRDNDGDADHDDIGNRN